MEPGAPLTVPKGGWTHGEPGGPGFGHQNQVPPGTDPSSRWAGKVFAGKDCCQKPGSDSAAGYFPQEHLQHHESKPQTTHKAASPPKSFPCQGWGSPWAGSPQREQEMGRLWGARGASSPQLFGGTWGGGTGKSPPRMRCLSETLQPEGFFFFLQEKMQTRVAITSGKRSLCYCCFIFV